MIAGDFMQLPVPVEHRCPAEVPWLAQDIFMRLGIPEDIAREDDPPYVAMLIEQYRMTPVVAGIVSDMFYGGRLRTSASASRRKVPAWTGIQCASSVVLIDTSDTESRASIPAGTYSRTNQIHADLARNVVQSISAAATGQPNASILVLSPFTQQVALLRNTLEPLVLRNRRIRLSTVHKAQGSEADTVLLCLDDAPGATTSQFMRARCWTETGARLLNVAISRTKGRLIVIAHAEHLRRTGGPVVQRLLELIEERGTVVWAADL